MEQHSKPLTFLWHEVYVLIAIGIQSEFSNTDVQSMILPTARVRGLEWTENRLLRGLLSVFLLFYALRGPSHALRGRST